MAIRYPEEVKRRARELFDGGATMAFIASELGVSIQTIGRWVKPEYEAVQEAYREQNRGRRREHSRVWRIKNPDKAREHSRKWASRNPDKIRESVRAWTLKNPDKILQKSREYRKRPEVKATRNKKQRQRYQQDPEFRVRVLTANRIKRALRCGHKSTPSEVLLGCKVQELVIAWNFKYGPEWQRNRSLHIDHIRPCASFNLEDPEQQGACFNWRNLQLLDGPQNLAKGDSWTPEMETNWALMMRASGYADELFLVFT